MSEMSPPTMVARSSSAQTEAMVSHRPSIPHYTQADPSRPASHEVLSILPSAASAAFDHKSKEHEAYCLDGTRVDVLRRIENWITGADSTGNVFWLSGMLGTGKSTIVRTISRQFQERNQLGASFFFKRGGGDASHAGLFVTTVAKQLAFRYRGVRNSIVQTLRNGEDIVTKTRSYQWQRLVIEPLKEMGGRGGNREKEVVLIVIDALDECENEQDIPGLISLFAGAHQVKGAKIRFLVASRAEPVIRGALGRVTHQSLVLHDEPRDVVYADICRYFRHRLSEIQLKRYWLQHEWPGATAIDRLAIVAGNQFIYAAIVCSLIDGSTDFGDNFLTTLINDVVTRHSSFTQALESDPSTLNLESMYRRILLKALPLNTDERESSVSFLGIISTLKEPLTVSAMSKLIARPANYIHGNLNDLHSVIRVPSGMEPELPVVFCHDTFRSFILNQTPTDKIPTVDQEEVQTELAIACIKLMSKNLARDICHVAESGYRRYRMSCDTFSSLVTAEVRYACRYWVDHVLLSSPSLLEDGGLVYSFLVVHLIYWMEAMSWMGVAYEISSLICKLQLQITDARRFALQNAAIIDKAPLQLYVSALHFSPKQSLVRRLFQDQMLVRSNPPSQAQTSWGPDLFKIDTFGTSAPRIALSPDGLQLFSASDNAPIQIWDLATGRLKMQIHDHEVLSWQGAVVTFVGDDRVCALDAQALHMWDVPLGERILIKSLKIPFSVKAGPGTVSSDGRLLALNLTHDLNGYSRFDMIRVYDIEHELLHDITVNESVRNLSISMDGREILITGSKGDELTYDLLTADFRKHQTKASRPRLEDPLSSFGAQSSMKSDDEEVLVWDSKTGREVRVYTEAEEERINAKASLSFSPDGKLVAGGKKSISIWNVRTGRLMQRLTGHAKEVVDVLFSPDSLMIVSTSEDHTIRVWDLTSPQRHRSEHYTNSSVTTLAFSPTGDRVISASEDQTASIWSLTGECLRKLDKHELAISCVAISPDARLAMTSTCWADSIPRYGQVRLWNIASGEKVWQFMIRTGVRTEAFENLRFSADGEQLETSGGTVYKLLDSITPTADPRLEHPIASPSPPQRVYVTHDSWVRYDGRDIIWLPQGYRASCLAHHGDTLAIGHATGLVTIIVLDGLWNDATTASTTVTVIEKRIL